jgi:small-conductance mechanosensitive channel
VIIRFTSALVRNSKVASAIAMAAWLFAALNIVGLIEPTLHVLDAMSVNIGHFRLSVLLVLKGAVFLTVLLWAANMSSRLLEQRLLKFHTMPPAMQVLTAKLAKVVLLTLAVVIALNAVGIDLTAFAVFSGAIGVGVGFGLQKVVSNLISGVILLLDRSIKPGDVIEIAGTYGWITRLNARFVSVSTRDGIEHLIPNEDLITQRVTNWSYSDDKVRLHVGLGIGYRCDVREAMRLCIEAAQAVKRVLETPAPVCLLKAFGDNAIDLELRFWIHDPRNGTANVRSEVMLGVWDRFREHGIEFPFPQRDLHIPDLEALADTIAMRFTGPRQDTAQQNEPKQD